MKHRFLTSSFSRMLLTPLAAMLLFVGSLRAAEYDIKSQSLLDALTEFGVQAGVQISVATESTEGKSSPGISGEMSLEAALDALLEGTDLVYEITGEDTVVVTLPFRTGGASYTMELAEVVLKGGPVERTFSETPSSVALYGETLISDLAGVDELRTLIDATPNVNFVGGNTGYTIRGFGVGGPLSGSASLIGGSNPRATVYRDGRPLSFTETIYGYAPLWDVEQVEVYRGAQTKARGANAIIGAIHINSKEPVHDDKAKVRGIYASEATYQFSAMGNVSVIEDELAVRVSADHRDHGTFLKLRPAGGSFVGDIGEDRDRTETTNARVIALYEPKSIDGLKTKLTYVRDEFVGPQAELARGPNFRNYESTNNQFSLFKGDSDTVIADVNWDHDSGFSVSNVFTYTDLFNQRLANPGDLSGGNSSDDWTNEFVVEFDDGESPLKGFMGIYVRKTEEEVFFPFTIPVTGELDFGGEKESLGIFGEFTYDLTDRLSVTGGLRYQEDKAERNGRGFFPPVPMFGFPGVDQTLDYDETFEEWLPRFSISYEIKDGSFVGFAVSKGSNPGGTSMDFAAFPTLVYEFDGETVWNYELFAKTEWWDGKLTADLNIFYSDYEDAQIGRVRDIADVPEVFGNLDGGTTVADIVNVDELVTYGAEAQLTYEVNRALSVYLNLGILETDISTEGAALGNIEDGNELPSAPDFSTTLGINYMPFDGLFISSQAKYRSETFSDSSNDPDFEVGGDDVIVDAQVAYQWDRYKVFAYATNVFDSYYELDRGFQSALQGTPRELGIGFEASF